LVDRPALSDWCDDGEECQVTLAFELNSMQYHVTRWAGGEARLTRDGAVLGNKDRRVTQEITALLRMSHRGFLAAYVAQQGQLNALADLGAEARKQMVCDLLQISEIDRAHAKVTSHSNTLRGLVTTLDKTLEPLNGYRQQLDEFLVQEQKHRSRAEEMEGTRDPLAAAAARAAGVRDAIQQSQDAEDRLRRLGHEHEDRAECEKEIEKLKRQLDDQLPLKAEKERLEREANRRSAQKAVETIERQLGEAHTERDAHQRRADTYAKIVDEANKSIAKWRAEKEARGAESQQLRLRAAELDGDASKLRGEAVGDQRALETSDQDLARVRRLGPETPCPTCKVPLGRNHSRVVAELEAAIENRLHAIGSIEQAAERLESDADELRLKAIQEETLPPALTDIDAEIARLEKVASDVGLPQGKELSSLGAWNQRITTLSDNVETSRAVLGDGPIDDDPDQLAEVERQLSVLAEARGRLAGEDARLGRMRSADLIASEIREADVHLKVATSILQDLNPYECPGNGKEELAFWGREAEDRKSALADWDRCIMETRGKEATAHSKAQVIAGVIADLEPCENERAVTAQAQQRATVLIDVVGRLRQRVMATIQPSLERHTATWLRALTNGKYDHVKVSDDYEVLIEGLRGSNGADTHSSGERDLVHFCFRMAISRHLLDIVGRHQGFIILGGCLS